MQIFRIQIESEVVQISPSVMHPLTNQSRENVQTVPLECT